MSIFQNRMLAPIRFEEFKRESIKAIEERMLNEKLRLEIEAAEESEAEAASSPRKKHKPVKKRPNKELAVGEKLPRKLKIWFRPDLFGKPIEEIDDFYKDHYVKFCQNLDTIGLCVMILFRLKKRSLRSLATTIKSIGSVPRKLFSFWVHSIGFDASQYSY